MKFSFFLTAPSGGGAEKAMILVANYLAEHYGHDIEMVLGRKEGPNLSLISSKVGIVDLHATGAKNLYFPFTRHIKKSSPDVVVSALMATDIAALLSKLFNRWNKTKLLISVQNHPIARAKGSKGGLEKYWPQFIKYFYKKADCLMGISYGVAEAVASLTKTNISQIEVIHNPAVSPGFYDKLNEEPDHPWLKNKETPVVIAAGRLITQKDFKTLIEAFAQVRKSTNAKLIIIGEGDKRTELEALIKQNNLADIVSLPGYVSNPYSWMRKADLFVLSSIWEGFANVIAEALACGTPVVSTDCPSGPAEILNNGEYGKLTPISDPNALAQAIISSLGDPTSVEPLKMRGNEFSIENIAPRYLTLLEKVAEQ